MARKATRKKAAAKRTAARKPAPRKRQAASRAEASIGLAPAFRGGHAHEDDGVCACDFVMDDIDVTPDDQLPAAKGGVEIIATRGRGA